MKPGDVIQLSEETKKKVEKEAELIQKLTSATNMFIGFLTSLANDSAAKFRKRLWQAIYLEHPELEKFLCDYDPEKKVVIIEEDKQPEEVSAAVH